MVIRHWKPTKNKEQHNHPPQAAQSVAAVQKNVDFIVLVGLQILKRYLD
jgi:hypothetical protein